MPEGLNWISMMDSLDKGDITKDEAIYELRYIDCLYKLLVWKLRDELYNQQRKQNTK